jgi:hypothetical protein
MSRFWRRSHITAANSSPNIKNMKEKIITLWVLVIARAPPNNNGERFFDSFSFNDRDAGSALINVVQFQAFSAFCCFC